MAEDTPAPEAEAPDTPEPEAPEGSDSPKGTPEETNWQERYENLQPEFTRATQEAAELRQYAEVVEALQSDDQEMVQAAIEALGLELVDEDGEEPDQFDEFGQRLEGIEAALVAQQQSAEEQQIQSQEIEYIDQALKGLESRIGRELTEPEVKLLVAHAALDRTETGEPGIEQAIALWDDQQKTLQQQWAQSKRVSTPAIGQEGSETLPLDATPAQRQADMVAKLRANEAQ